MTRARILADYVSGGTTAAEFDYLDGVTSNIQTQLDAKVSNATHTGDVTGSTALTIATDAVDIAMLSATGTASATTYLRGDNSWQTAGSTSATDLTSGTLDYDRFPAGTVLQVKQSIFTGVASYSVAASSSGSPGTQTTFGGTDLTVEITPEDTNSKMLLRADLYAASTGNWMFFTFNSSVDGLICRGDSQSDDRFQSGTGVPHSTSDIAVPVVLSYLDTPSDYSGAITYSITFFNGGSASHTFFINDWYNSSGWSRGTQTSTISVMEIAQ